MGMAGPSQDPAVSSNLKSKAVRFGWRESGRYGMTPGHQLRVHRTSQYDIVTSSLVFTFFVFCVFLFFLFTDVQNIQTIPNTERYRDMILRY